jgi:hypothetical protein
MTFALSPVGFRLLHFTGDRSQSHGRCTEKFAASMIIVNKSRPDLVRGVLRLNTPRPPQPPGRGRFRRSHCSEVEAAYPTWLDYSRGPVRKIEETSDRLAQGRALRVLNEHRRPRHRLERQPMQSDRAAKRENRGDAANAMKHDLEPLTERRHPVNCLMPPSRKRISHSLSVRNENTVAVVEISCRSNAGNMNRLLPRSG